MSSLVTPGLKTKVSQTAHVKTSPGSSGSGGACVRVLKVILKESDMSSEGWKRWGYSQALYGLFYQELFKENAEDVKSILSDENRNFAYCGKQSLRRIPIENEIVMLDSVPDFVKSEERNSIPTLKTIWTEIVAGWNHPSLNQYPDVLRNGEASVTTGTNFVESFNVNPLQLCPGDFTIEGRYGNSIRFGGTWYDSSPISTKNTNGKAYLIIRNGQGVTSTRGDQPVYEDINKDACSIYCTDGQKVSLQQASTKHSAYVKGKEPVQASNYTKPQIIASSERIFLNGRDDLQLSAKTSIGATATEINLDGDSQVSLDAKKIYLGSGAQEENEPCLKGTTTTNMMSDILDKVNTFLDTLISAPPAPEVFVGLTKTGAAICKQQLLTYQSQLKRLHSTKTFVE